MVDLNRRIEALRALAERPGTEAEGRVARAMLAKAQAAQPASALDPIAKYRQFMRTGSINDLADAMGPQQCQCGAWHRAFQPCEQNAVHERIAKGLREKFPPGMRVYYNRWAYRANCGGRIVSYNRQCWDWARIQFDHMRSVRSVPIYSPLGPHISLHPIDEKTLRESGLRGGMEKIEDVNGINVA